MKYKISLTPLGRYFFGGDMTFKVANRSQYNEQYGSYIIRSNQFPQQTSLLGMMRFLLLSNHTGAFNKDTHKITSTQEAGKLIGPRGFVITDEYEKNNYGLIKNISFCFLEIADGKGVGQVLLPAPKDYGYEVDFDTSTLAVFNEHHSPMPVITGYNPKEYKEPVFLKENQPISSSQLFLEDVRIGIEKKYDGKTDENDNAYYKQIYYRLGDDKWAGKIHFTFYVEVEDRIDLTQKPYQRSVVSLGGDNSSFVFEAFPCAEEVSVAYAAGYNEPFTWGTDYKVVLLSDAYLLRSEVEGCIYAISGVKPFRFLQTMVATKDYTILSSDSLRSKKYYLYEKGSVFYCTKEQLDKFLIALDKPCFRQIGYNACQVLIKK